MTRFELVKQNVCTPKAAAQYGLEVSRNGMARCPFHDDRHPGMKLNRDYFYCFGCGASGDVINLTARLLGLSNSEAAKRLAADFELDENTVHRPQTLWDDQRRLQRWKSEFKPRTPSDELDARYVEACKELDYVEYLLEEERCHGKERKNA